MSKYIIDIPKTVGMLEAVGSVHYTYFDGIQCKTIVLKSDEIEELNSDYINEHFRDLQGEAHKRGYKDCETRYCSFDACPNRQAEYQRGLEEGKKAFDLLDEERDAEYQRGLNDAWEAARKIFGYEMDGGIPIAEIGKVFGYAEDALFCTADIIRHNTATEAIEKLKAYEEKQKAEDEIKVGDEVVVTDRGTKYVVVSFGEYFKEKTACGFGADGVWYGNEFSKLRKTGRHFDIASILEEMRND